MDFNKEIEFIARHYREGIFNTETVLKKIRRKKIWTFSRIAAASILLAVFGATAAIIINSYNTENTENNISVFPPEQPEFVVRAIDFDDTPLPVVIDKINEVYNIEVENLPRKPEKYRLSLHYEGNASDLIDTINDILGTEMKIKK